MSTKESRTGRRPGRAERSDSVRNREKLVAAAQEVFADEGLNAPLDRIATRAGVGPGTLYRHFPSRIRLLEAVLEEPLQEQLRLARSALDNPDRWTGLADYIMTSCAIEAESNGYRNLMTTRYHGSERLLELRAAIHRTVARLVLRARNEGVVRPDFRMEDLIFVSLSSSKVAEMTRTIAPGAWRRNVELFLEAIQPERAHPLKQRPMTPAQVRQTMELSIASPPRTRGEDAG